MKTQSDIRASESKVYSQNGEDGILATIFEEIGTTNRFSVEFGASMDGQECCTRLLAEQGWNALRMDLFAHPGSPVKWAYICAENVEEVFQKHTVPAEPDLLVIDIDGIDFWVWNAIENYRPRVVVVEYNANLKEPVTVVYHPLFRWDGSFYFGASLAAFDVLARAKGYTLVYCDTMGINAFFVRDDVAEHFERRSAEELYRPPAYRGALGEIGHSPDPLKRPWLDVTTFSRKDEEK